MRVGDLRRPWQLPVRALGPDPLYHRDADAALAGGRVDTAACGERGADCLLGLAVDAWASEMLALGAAQAMPALTRS
jgi:hypothetical protein